MSLATLARPTTPVDAPHRAVRQAAERLADAETEYDTALDAGVPMITLVKLDQEVAAAARSYHGALAALTRE